MDKKVFVAMSGGVDSSVAALLLKKEGYDVTGVFMRCYNLDGCATRDAEDARRVAGHLRIPFYVWNFEEEYKRRVVDYMIKGYRKGITPNPDVMCNREIKFGLFLKRALALGADFVATGHYVRLHTGSRASPYILFAARDKNKDQSYFLWTLTQKELQYCLFPIGDYLKPEVRTIARRAKLPTAAKKDSQGICFLGKFSLKDFLKKRIRSRRGNVVTTSGVPVGEHEGAALYTIGQRHLGVANSKWQRASSRGKDPKPLYVVEKNIKTNIVVVAEGDDNPALYKKELVLADVSFIVSRLPLSAKRLSLPVMARVRYRQPLAAARITNNELRIMRGKKGIIPNSQFVLRFSRSQRFVAPGQSAVFYECDPSLRSGGRHRLRLLGGGVIAAAN